MSVQQDVTNRVTEWLSTYNAKELANMFGAAPRTAKGWLGGQLPQNKYLILMIERWGQGFVDHVFEPALSSTVTDDQRLDRISSEIQLMRSRTKAFVTLVFVLLSMGSASFGDDPLLRVKTPRARRQIEDQI